MWDGYVEMAKEIFVNARIVVDRFHFFSHLQKAVDTLRKEIRRKKPKLASLKNCKWLLLKNTEDLSGEEQAQLAALWQEADLTQLKKVYDAKNSFRAILEEQIDSKVAEKKIEDWIATYQIEPLKKFMEMLGRWKKYILNYFDGRFTTGIIEGINNKIKLIKRRAFGFANFSNFRRVTMIEFLCSWRNTNKYPI